MMAERNEVLVAILNNPRDLRLAEEEHWYRIPIQSADKWLKGRWPPLWLAFYQPKVFGREAFSINYYSKVLAVRRVYRGQLFPNEPQDRKAAQPYYQLMLEPLRRLPQPIVSRRWRRIVFISTTWEKFSTAVEINDLYDESPLEDRLWAELRRLQIGAERQEFIKVNGRDYALDFAVYCEQGKLNIETDGDTWHSDPQRIPQDNLRDNDLETSQWRLLRFNTLQIREQMETYCVPTIVDTINRLGGVSEGRFIAKRINQNPAAPIQLSLFDDLPK